MISPHARRRSLNPALFTALTAVVLAFLAASLLLSPLFLIAWQADRPHPVGLVEELWYLAEAFLKFPGHLSDWVKDPAAAFGAIFELANQSLAKVDLVARFAAVAAACGVAATTAACAAFAVVWRATPRLDRLSHLGGRKLVLGARAIQAFKKATKAAIGATGKGLELAPGMVIPRERETRHFLLIGATGSGKTVIIRSLLRQLLRRRDRVLIHDTKGDVTETLPTDAFTLLAPHDARSAIWDIAADVRTAQEARELAAAFIPESKEPIWSAGARELMAGAIIVLQRVFGRKWGWANLSSLLFGDVLTLREQLIGFAPEISGYIDLDEHGRPTRVAMSFIVTMRAHLAKIVLPLADAWTTDAAKPRFSVRRWLQDEDADQRVLILQRAAHLPELSTAWTGALVRILANNAVGPLLPDDSKRRIWLVLDEFPQLGRLDGFNQVLEKGRSRGVCAILAIQDTSQLEEIYGEHAAATWLSSISTKIIGRLEGGATANFVCDKLIGQRTIEWTEKAQSTNPTKADGTGGGTSRSRVSKHEKADVVTPAFLESELGRQDNGLVPTIKALVVGFEGLVLEGRWPIESWPKLRSATIPAPWNEPKTESSN